MPTPKDDIKPEGIYAAMVAAALKQLDLGQLDQARQLLEQLLADLNTKVK